MALGVGRESQKGSGGGAGGKAVRRLEGGGEEVSHELGSGVGRTKG